jgi:DNA repair exonuclease SbcCD nuclease subunit
MKAIIFSDMHFYNNPAKSYITDNGKFSWFETQLKIAQNIFDIARKLDVEVVIHNGDLFHEKTRLNIGLYNDVWQFFKGQKDEGFDVILNTGNHDMLTRHFSTLKPFSEIARVITQPTTYKYEHVNMVFVPYGQEEGNLKIPDGAGMTNILFTHADIAGLQMGVTDYVSGSPFKYQTLGDWDFVFNGHVHKPQELANIGFTIGEKSVKEKDVSFGMR